MSLLPGRRFVLRTNHGSLSWSQNFREPEGQLAHWLEQLQEFDFEVVHRRGIKHINADALSRLPCNHNLTSLKSTQQSQLSRCQGPLPLLESEALRAMQLADSTLGPLLRGKEENRKPNPRELKSLGRPARCLLQIWDHLHVQNGTFCRIFAHGCN